MAMASAGGGGKEGGRRGRYGLDGAPTRPYRAAAGWWAEDGSGALGFRKKTTLGLGESREPLDKEINAPKIKCF